MTRFPNRFGKRRSVQKKNNRSLLNAVSESKTSRSLSREPNYLQMSTRLSGEKFSRKTRSLSRSTPNRPWAKRFLNNIINDHHTSKEQRRQSANKSNSEEELDHSENINDHAREDDNRGDSSGDIKILTQEMISPSPLLTSASSHLASKREVDQAENIAAEEVDEEFGKKK